MSDPKDKGNTNILDAVELLSSMAELNVEEIALDKKERAAEGKGGSEIRAIRRRWLDTQDKQKTADAVKDTLRVVHNYLKHIYVKDKRQLKDVEFQKGVRSIIELADEAVNRIDQCGMILSRGKKISSLSETREYIELQSFYKKKILSKFQKALEEEERWQEDWGDKAEESVVDIEKKGLRSLETITKDRDYELFYMTKDNGGTYYNPNLARHVRLVANFDQLISTFEGEDPLVRVKLIQDHEAHDLAIFVKEHIQNIADQWCHECKKSPEQNVNVSLYQAMMALYMAANPRNQLQRTTGKCSIAYFRDFHHYLRKALHDIQYLELIDNPPDGSNKMGNLILKMIHGLCEGIYLNRINHRRSISFLYGVIADEEEKLIPTKGNYQYLQVWNKALEIHEGLTLELQKHPSGPLFKVLDILNEPHAFLSFDPLGQDNYPQNYFSATLFGKKVEMLRMPSPTIQKKIDKTEIAPEFVGYLRELNEGAANRKLFVFNFQDRTSWKEYHRSNFLEVYQRDAEVRWHFWMCTFPKDTDFYSQAEEYLKLDDANDFMEGLTEQVCSEGECGFHFFLVLDREMIKEFVQELVKLIHKHFFGGKKKLSRKNRLDFILIFYQFLILKLIENQKPTRVAFMCKDGVDIGATSLAGFFGFLRVLASPDEWKDSEVDLFIDMLMLPALLIRERPVDGQRLHRTVSMLSVLAAELETNRGKILGDFEKLYEKGTFSKITLESLV
ncbi:MAG: hypothetical protein S4CHLAM102_03670 [Chlamydiia bacterium]|nr:hypothetical protein [Chlamydiia bacterium]